MKIRHLLLSCLLAVSAAAQTSINVPPTANLDVNLPFAAGVGRYQQWYSFNALSALTEPQRFTKIEFIAGSNVAPPTVQINCEVRIGHGKFSGAFGAFDNNWSEPPLVVKPLGNTTLSSAPNGAVCFSVPFNQVFTWDHFRPILVEIRINGNSLGNQPFNYNLQGTSIASGLTNRVYANGSAGAPSGTVTQGFGMITRFTTVQGANLQFGSGCPAEGAIVPGANVVEVPSPGIVWNHQILNAPSSRPAFWVIGDMNLSSTPIDLTAVFGLPPSVCFLLTNPVNIVGPIFTVGGGAGAGFAQFGIPLPATTNYIGVSLFTQWVVFDPLSINGFLAVTPATWSIVGS